jgi:ferredoxin-NADP reductase
MPAPPRFTARLVAAAAITPLVRKLDFVRTDGAPMRFEPGQWVNLLIPVSPPAPSNDAGATGPVPWLRRAYSIASPPREDGTFELAVTRVQGGPGSNFLHALEIGAEIEVEGPQGFFTRTPEFAAPTLFVATGTGLTPLRSMLLAAIEAGARTRTHVLLGVRHEADLLFREELEALARAHDWLTVTFTLSRPSEAWTGARGYVQNHVRAALAELARHGEPHVFACGLQRMVGAVRELVRKELEFPRQRMHAERFD